MSSFLPFFCPLPPHPFLRLPRSPSFCPSSDRCAVSTSYVTWRRRSNRCSLRATNLGTTWSVRAPPKELQTTFCSTPVDCPTQSARPSSLKWRHGGLGAPLRTIRASRVDNAVQCHARSAVPVVGFRGSPHCTATVCAAMVFQVYCACQAGRPYSLRRLRHRVLPTVCRWDVGRALPIRRLSPGGVP